LLTEADGSPWTPGQQADRINAACAAAGVKSVTFHGCHHTYASRLVMKGVPLAVVAAQLGHGSIKQVEKHYGHLCPNYVSAKPPLRSDCSKIADLRSSPN